MAAGRIKLYITAMPIPSYPEKAPLSLDMQPILRPRLASLADGISEFTFAGLYLFRKTYGYEVSMIAPERLAIFGSKHGRRFFMLPCGLPEDQESILPFFEREGYLKALSEAHADPVRIWAEQHDLVVQEDRDNFDYLYRRADLAELAGRRYHKKRNLVNAFINNYNYLEQPLTQERVPDARRVLDKWREGHEGDGDYYPALEALELMRELKLKGYLVSVDGVPAAYTMGEPLMKGKSFVVHIEKAIDHYKGIYQFINRSFAKALAQHYVYINREQDLGDEGLRQAKMTYRPSGFVKKYRVYRKADAALDGTAPSVAATVPAEDTERDGETDDE